MLKTGIATKTGFCFHCEDVKISNVRLLVWEAVGLEEAAEGKYRPNRTFVKTSI